MFRLDTRRFKKVAILNPGMSAVRKATGMKALKFSRPTGGVGSLSKALKTPSSSRSIFGRMPSGKRSPLGQLDRATSLKSRVRRLQNPDMMKRHPRLIGNVLNKARPLNGQM